MPLKMKILPVMTTKMLGKHVDHINFDASGDDDDDELN